MVFWYHKRNVFSISIFIFFSVAVGSFTSSSISNNNKFSYHHLSLRKKATIHQVTMIATSKNVPFPGHNHLLTTSTEDPTLIIAQVPASEGSLVPVVRRWLWPGNRTFLEVASTVVTWRIVVFCAVYGVRGAQQESFQGYKQLTNSTAAARLKLRFGHIGVQDPLRVGYVLAPGLPQSHHYLLLSGMGRWSEGEMDSLLFCVGYVSNSGYKTCLYPHWTWAIVFACWKINS